MKAYNVRYITKKDYEVIKSLGRTLHIMYVLMRASFEYGNQKEQENCIRQFLNLKATLKDLSRWYVANKLVFRKPKYYGYIVIK